MMISPVSLTVRNLNRNISQSSVSFGKEVAPADNNSKTSTSKITAEDFANEVEEKAKSKGMTMEKYSEALLDEALGYL